MLWQARPLKWPNSARAPRPPPPNFDACHKFRELSGEVVPAIEVSRAWFRLGPGEELVDHTQNHTIERFRAAFAGRHARGFFKQVFRQWLTSDKSDDAQHPDQLRRRRLPPTPGADFVSCIRFVERPALRGAGSRTTPAATALQEGTAYGVAPPRSVPTLSRPQTRFISRLILRRSSGSVVVNNLSCRSRHLKTVRFVTLAGRLQPT